MAEKLSECKKNNHYKIVNIEGNDETNRFFKHVGIHLNDVITLVNILNQHYIIYSKGSRYAMEKILASSLMVERYD